MFCLWLLPRLTVRSYDILTYSNGKVAPSVFLSCREQTLTMHVNGVPFVRVACSGQHLRYLVPGFLYSCGLIESLHDLAGVDVTPLPAASSVATSPDGAEEVRVDVPRGPAVARRPNTEQAVQSSPSLQPLVEHSPGCQKIAPHAARGSSQLGAARHSACRAGAGRTLRSIPPDRRLPQRSPAQQAGHGFLLPGCRAVTTPLIPSWATCSWKG